jgi:hypothetical protein
MSTVTPASPTERFIGRALACCVHPYASWRRLPTSGRVCLVAAYTGIGYVTTICLLFIG